jgi:hypothetical protein
LIYNQGDRHTDLSEAAEGIEHREFQSQAFEAASMGKGDLGVPSDASFDEHPMVGVAHIFRPRLGFVALFVTEQRTCSRKSPN